MPFIPNAEQIARVTIKANGHPNLAEKFAVVIRFLALNPASASGRRRKNAPVVGTIEYIKAAAAVFANARAPKKPEPPATVPDEMVSFMLHHYFGIPEANLEHIKRDHLLSMAAENMVGDLLERYLAEGLEPAGWVWISGSLIKGADFLKPPSGNERKWFVLQVKNRDNSENSSSSAIRVGTEIKKWFRTFSKKPGSNWDKFPDTVCRVGFSENGFRKFVKSHLRDLKAT
jgi:hypothetical protein